eukprot:1189762-Prorocentrum_minimum.AAC.5
MHAPLWPARLSETLATLPVASPEATGCPVRSTSLPIFSRPTPQLAFFPLSALWFCWFSGLEKPGADGSQTDRLGQRPAVQQEVTALLNNLREKAKRTNAADDAVRLKALHSFRSTVAVIHRVRFTTKGLLHFADKDCYLPHDGSLV